MCQRTGGVGTKKLRRETYLVDLSVLPCNLISRANGSTEKSIGNIKALLRADSLADSVDWAR